MSEDNVNNIVNRREFTKLSLAAAASALQSSGAESPMSLDRVDDFRRVDSFYAGDGWESLNPGYWKIENKTLRRRLHSRGSRARHTGFPFHAYMETEYETRSPYGMIWRRDWKLAGNYHLQIKGTIHARPRKNPEAGYSLAGLCLGGRTLFESWRAGEDVETACWFAAWRDDGRFGVYSHNSDDPRPVQAGAEGDASPPQAGDRFQIDVEVSGEDAVWADVAASLSIGEGSALQVPCSKVPRQEHTEGYFGVAARGELDFSVETVEILPGENTALEAPVNELLVCYPLGDSLREIDGKWRCRFIALFRQEGRRAEIRIATSENPEKWQSVPAAGRGAIVTNDFRRATAVLDCELPTDPSQTTLYYTVWKDGEDLTRDPRPGARPYVGRLPRLGAPYRLCGLSCHAINGDKPGMQRTKKFQENWIHHQPLPDAYQHLEDYGFQVMVWEDDIWYLELILYTTSTDDAYKIITETIAGPTTRWQMMRHWNVLNPGDHDHGMDDVKGPEQIAIRNQPGLGQDIEYMQRNFQIVEHLIRGDDSPSGRDNPKRWRRWKMPNGDFSLLIVDARLWRTSQDTHIWATEGWGNKGHVYDRKDPTRSLLGEEQFAWLERTIRTDSSPLICITGINGLHTVWRPSAEAEQRNRVAADYAGWVKAGADRVIELLSSRDGVVSVYGDVHVGSIFRNRPSRLYECSFGPIGRTGGRGVKDGFGSLMEDYDGREIDAIALFHPDYESPDLRRQTTPDYWNFLEMEFDPAGVEPKLALKIRRLNDPPDHEPRGGGSVEVAASRTGRVPSSRLPKLKTLPNAEVRFSKTNGEPIRGTRSLDDGSVPVAGLVDVPPRTRLVVTSVDGRRAEAQIIETLALA